MGKRGVTLIELLAAVFLIAVVVSSMALFLPRASKAAISGHYQITAKSLAAGKIQELKQDPYPIVRVTPQTDFQDPDNLAPALTCDCNHVSPASLPLDLSLNGTGKLNENGITFTRRVCVNLVNATPIAGNWTSNCPDGTSGTDKGLKNIRVLVSWTAPGGTPQSVEFESVVGR